MFAFDSKFLTEGDEMTQSQNSTVSEENYDASSENSEKVTECEKSVDNSCYEVNDHATDSKQCPFCGNSIPAHAKFCFSCGKKTENNGKKNKKVIFAICVVVALIFSLSYIWHTISSVNKFADEITLLIEKENYKDAYDLMLSSENGTFLKDAGVKRISEAFYESMDDKDYTSSMNIFNTLCSEYCNDEVDDMVLRVKNVINAMVISVENKDVSLSDVSDDFTCFKNFSSEIVSSYSDEKYLYLDNLEKSRVAYETAVSYEESLDYYNAIVNYKKVVDVCPEYEISRNKLVELMPLYKAEVVEKSSLMVAEKNYTEALDLLDLYISICDVADEEVSIIRTQYTELKEAYDRQVAKENQLVTVTSVYLDKGGIITWNKGFSVVFENNSDKVVKEIAASIISYDVNGYPLRYGNSRYQDSSTKAVRVSADAVNIMPGAKKRCFWDDFNNDSVKASACVRTVTFMDGTTWTNEYYNYWLEEHKKQYVAD